MRRTLLAWVVLLSFISVSTKSYADKKEVTVPVAGKLKSLLDKKEYLTITDLTIKGKLNDKDLKTLDNLANIERLDMSEAEGLFTYFPTFTKLTTLLMPPKCGDNHQTIKSGEYVYLSDGIKKNTSLISIFVHGDIASRLGVMPNLKKIGLYTYHTSDYCNNGDEYLVDKDIVDTLYVFDYIDNDLHHFGLKSFNHYIPRIIVDLTQNLTILNTYDPERNDYKGINVLPVFPNPEVKTPEILDLSDVKIIPNGYFKNGTMEKVIFSEQLRFIGHNAFENCNNLTEVVFSEKLECVERDAFKNCKNLKEATFPGKDVALKITWPFDGCSNLKYIHFQGPTSIAGSYVDANHCVLEFDQPSAIRFVEVASAFGHLSPFGHFIFNAVPTQLELGEKYGQSVGDMLSYVEVPANTASSFTEFIDEKYIFEKGKKTKSYILSLEQPGKILSSLPMDELDIIDSLTIVGFLYDTDLNIINKCKRLSYLDLGRAVITYSPETLKKEHQEMQAVAAIFAMAGAVADAKYDNFEMNALDHAYIKIFEQLAKGASSVTSADDNCIVPSGSFSNCTQLKKVILPYRAKHIGKDVLSNCPNLESVELPLYLETIRNNSFTNCLKLKDVKFPSTLNYIGGSSFYGCNSIEVVDLSQCHFNIGYNTKAEWNGTFKNCASLKELHLPQGIKTIWGEGYGHINGDPLNVYIPATVEKINDSVGWVNAKLYFEGPTAPNSIHVSKYDKFVIYCPKGSITSYYNAVSGWRDNVKIIEQ